MRAALAGASSCVGGLCCPGQGRGWGAQYSRGKPSIPTYLPHVWAHTGPLQMEGLLHRLEDHSDSSKVCIHTCIASGGQYRLAVTSMMQQECSAQLKGATATVREWRYHSPCRPTSCVTQGCVVLWQRCPHLRRDAAIAGFRGLFGHDL